MHSIKTLHSMPDQPIVPNANRITVPPPNLPRPTVPASPAPMPQPMPAVTVPPRPTMPPPAPTQVPPRAPAPIPPAAPAVPSIPPRPVAPPPPVPAAPSQGYTSELRTMSADIGSIKVGQAPAGIKPPMSGAPAAPSMPAPSIAIPAASAGGILKKIGFGLLVVIALAIIWYVISAMTGGGTQEATPTPSPSTSAAASPTQKSLNSYFGNPGSSINLQNPTTATDDFVSALVSVQPSSKQTTVIPVQHVGSTATPQIFFTDILGSVPASLSATFGSDWLLAAYGQSEHFTTTGTIDTANTTVGTRPVIVIALNDASTANQAMGAWEGSGLAAAFAKPFQYDASKRSGANFSSGVYRQIPVRYQNYPYADKSLDYAIVTASNNTNYLVLASSRESLFFVIDQLMQ